MRDSFAETLLMEAKANPNIILITGDLGFGVLDRFQEELPEQFINSGVAEQTMMGMAAGIASTGKRVFVYSIGNFPTFRCLEQIRNDVCSMNNSVVVVSVGAGYAYGSQGYTHHALEDIAVMRSLPNMQVVVPADPQETKLLTSILSKTSSPSYLRLGKSKESAIHQLEITMETGKAITLFNGDDGTIIFCGSIGVLALKARDVLKKMNIDVGVVSVPFISNLDSELLTNLAKKGPIVTIEEHSPRGGFGSAILELFSALRIQTDVRILAAKQSNLALIGDQDFLRQENGLTVEQVVSEFINFTK